MPNNICIALSTLQAVKLGDAWPIDPDYDYLRQPILTWLAIAKARSGDSASAQCLITTTPTDCYLCVRAQGQIAALGRDQTTAECWSAEAIEQRPGLPQACVDRGNAYLSRYNVSGAMADAEQAAKLNPHFADAWKMSGDALAPALGIRNMSSLIQLMSAGKDVVLATVVPLNRRDVPDRAVAMLSVVPGDEAMNPSARSVGAGERKMRIRRRVLQSSDERLGVRIVVGDVRPAEGRHDAKPLQRCDHRVSTHGLTVVGVQ